MRAVECWKEGQKDKNRLGLAGGIIVRPTTHKIMAC